MTFPAWAPSAMPCSHSCTATTAPPGRSTGSSPPATSPHCSAASASTSKRSPASNPLRPGPPDNPPTNLRCHPLSCCNFTAHWPEDNWPGILKWMELTRLTLTEDRQRSELQFCSPPAVAIEIISVLLGGSACGY